jgi:hypothetical protein
MGRVSENKINRKGFGLITIVHRGKPVTTSVGSKRYESRFCGLASTNTFSKKLGTIPFGYEHRPELISYLFLGSAVSWWEICERNSIFDVFEQMNTGDNIFIPGA